MQKLCSTQQKPSARPHTAPRLGRRTQPSAARRAAAAPPTAQGRA
ncbi:hypothetical protein SCATT_47760 [Streptantibioticus cattleyicolor NRRL 8057 = DSM 46488]|uniref:Uncharacterized protein n=1 Tax=Streptantibioticus cattleyicolor (strain ATCC 35852 / DSM 46488 / JCM 4925 / NBRC 14057 / NRRL 8057) TaxID=1003195 RepID=G8WV64_STREN|nr:hypothetical protein SCATT_47760 [Streptantibioticus cattleyicolor NRRL 8057 = DSM 46488]